MKSYVLKLTGAVAIDGQISRAGSLVEVSEPEAKNLLARGKGVLATAEDGVEQPETPPADEEIELARLSKIELLGLAKQKGVDVADGMTKAQIIEAIEAAATAGDGDELEGAE